MPNRREEERDKGCKIHWSAAQPSSSSGPLVTLMTPELLSPDTPLFYPYLDNFCGYDEMPDNRIISSFVLVKRLLLWEGRLFGVNHACGL